MWRRFDARSDEAAADQSGQADAEDGERKARRHLIYGKTYREPGEQGRHEHPGEHPGESTDDDRPGEMSTGKSARCAHDHHAFETEIEHAGALGDELAGRR